MPQGIRATVPTARALALLRHGEVTLEAVVAWSSNATVLVEVSDGALGSHAIYKPRRGERPLHDFPRGTLCQREVAAFLVSEALGWELVPPTVLREGPLGIGALQMFVPHDPDLHYLSMSDPDRDVIRRIVAFDIVINNADRKSGHVLSDENGRLWVIDHGISFHVEPKLRTVIWDHVGEPIPEDLLSDLRDLRRELDRPASDDTRVLRSLLSQDELAALADRTAALASSGRFPAADPGRREYPWPPV